MSDDPHTDAAGIPDEDGDQAPPAAEEEQQPLTFQPKPTRRESRIMAAADQIHQVPALEDDEVSYWPRGLISCTLPHSNPGDDESAYSRSSGAYYILIQPGVRPTKGGGFGTFGYPFGSYPRLFCSYLAREVTKTREREVSLGDTLSGFMAELGLQPTGGRWGTIPNLRRQVLALVNAKIAFGYQGDEPVDAGGQQLFADRYALWWDAGEDQGALWPNYVRLSEPMFSEILEHAVPVDMRILRAIKQSSLALDLYAWTTYKVFRMGSATRISWKALHAQFGSEYARVCDFRVKALRHLRAIKALYPDLKFTTERGRLVLWPSRTSVVYLPPKED